MNTKDFENSVMTRLDGQAPLPQGIFRQFLGWLEANIQEESTDLTPYQKKSDNELNTTAKTVVGGINELKAAMPTLSFAIADGYLVITSGSDQYKVEVTAVEAAE